MWAMPKGQTHPASATDAYVPTAGDAMIVPT